MSGTISKTAALFALTLMGVALSGCGRHGPLSAPEGSTSPVKIQPAENEEERDPSSMALPGVDGQETKKESKKIERPKRPFILDPIL
jgi:predicted small lipoprotein YifL